ncbi:MAG: NAD-dependent epimerase/dehydratase family protein [Bacteroidetes bacterium]|nr:NAD-dependent epimerase/dehydratase family protein [Bacteroidota bacterium]MBP7399193.1 NAD-dependent epimerase/dehydratase family protein [Chitinophagales bacterium]MBP8754155.1 NAD-dependent epimerase/dehydratase family protein [Chitinophagales bacterium]MBP9189579.1 NAD-dependent epimerase/dehydratase family protein [Chitinophagales bacterium]MBP9549090.1 NAD-dependent epimerase/dehydratase family protein [Chitinophagales bacterium]
MQQSHFITGANGLVGSYLARYLLMKGERVRALRRNTSDLKLVADIADEIEWIIGDITDVDSLAIAMEGVDYVYHTAAIISYVKKDAEKLMNINVEGTANVVNICLELQIKKMLHVSSIAAVGRTGISGELVVENNKWENINSTSDYSLSKHLAEREVWRGIAEGLNAVIINPSIIVGSGNWNSGSCRLFTTVNNGFKFYTEGITGYVDVRDVVEIAYRLMQSEIHSERFILNSENIMYKNFLWMVADALQVKRPPYKAKQFMSELAWRADALRSIFTGQTPSVTKTTARIANKQVYFDSSKIQEQLDYTFSPVAKAVADTGAAFIDEKKSDKFHPIVFK